MKNFRLASRVVLITAMLLALAVAQDQQVEQAAPALSLLPPVTADGSFEVTVRVDTISTFRGMEFSLVLDDRVTVLADARGTGQLAGVSVTANTEENKVVVYSADEILGVSGDIVVLTLTATGDSGDSAIINLANSLISDGTNTVGHSVTGTTITLSECVDYPNTHTGETGGIPGTTCACNEETNLVISPTTQKWACQVENVETLFENAQDCSLGGDPIYNTGFCCVDEYQLNPQFNNFDDLLGEPTEACTLIPNQAPIANIFQPPATIRVGEATEFSSLGSADLDGELVSFSWDFGDGTTSDLTDPTHTFTSISACPAEVCTITLTVTDDDDETNSFSAAVSLIVDPTFVPDVPVCGNNILDPGEVCDGDDAAVCTSTIGGLPECKPDCSGCQAPTSPTTGDPLDLDVDETFDPAEAETLGLTLGGETELEDDVIVTTDAAGTVTDIRTETSPPVVAACGNAICEIGESSSSCLQDCHVGDGICQKSYGETSKTSPSDCPKSFSFLLIPLILLLLLGGGAFIAVRKGWINLGPIMHKDQQGPSGGAQFDLKRAAVTHAVQRPHPHTDNLVNYIQATRAQGLSFSQVKDSLLKKGWSEDTINSAFAKAG